MVSAATPTTEGTRLALVLGSAVTLAVFVGVFWLLWKDKLDATTATATVGAAFVFAGVAVPALLAFGKGRGNSEKLDEVCGRLERIERDLAVVKDRVER